MKSMKKCVVTKEKISKSIKLDKRRDRRRSSAGMFYTSSAGAVTSLILMLLLGVLLNNTVFGASYSITYNDSVISDMPVDEAGTTSGSVPLSSNTPTSIERRFTGWCLGTSSSSNITTSGGVDSCSSTTYLPGASLPISQSSADNYLYAMWTNVVPVTFNLGTGVTSIVVNDTTITSSGTTLNLVANRGYSMTINYASGYMPVNPSATVTSGDVTADMNNIFVGLTASTVTVSGQTKKNVNVSFALDNVKSVTVNGQTTSSSVSLMGYTTYTVTVNLDTDYSFLYAYEYSAEDYGYKVSNVDTTNNKFDLYVGFDSGTIEVSGMAPVCVDADTLITLADGTKKRVADLSGDELLLVWDFDTASYTAAPTTFIDTDPEQEYDIIHIYFSDDNGGETDVEVMKEHGFFDYTLGKFVYISEDGNPEQYLGHEFIMQDGDTYKTVKLTDIKHEKKVTTPYSPVTYKHFNYFTNDMLSMPGGIEGMFNYFEVDKDTMGYDKEKKQADIEKYGLLTLEDFDGLIDELGFEAYNGQYLNIAIGKGLITWDGIKALADKYGHFTAEQLENGKQLENKGEVPRLLKTNEGAKLNTTRMGDLSERGQK
ncbi:hypothetical protein IJJ02_00215 [Candidatus Saccharibacteria bacterium]|nr:hypothetical protein [Candidatus Saccharibacteria bacterium]